MNTVDRLYHAMHPLHAEILVYTLLAFNYCDPSEYWFSCNYICIIMFIATVHSCRLLREKLNLVLYKLH